MANADQGAPSDTDPRPGTTTLADEGRRARRVTTSTTTTAPLADDVTTSTPAADDLVVDAGGVDDDTARRFWGEDERPPRPDPADPAAVTAEPQPTRRLRLARRRGRRVDRVVRNVSTWSVFKLAVPFFACLWAVVLIAGIILWSVSEDTGLIGNAESFWAEATGNETVEWDGAVVLRSAAVASGVLALASVGFAVLFAVLFNLICDMTGGIRLLVLELEPQMTRAERRSARRAAKGAKATTSRSGGRHKRKRS